MPTALQYLESAKPRKYRIVVVFGADPALRADAVDRSVVVTAPQERVDLRVGGGEDEVSAARVWDAVTTQSFVGVRSRMVVVRSADRIRSWGPLQRFIEGAAVFPETTLVLELDRPELGTRQRNRLKSLPGAPVWETVYAEWEGWLRDYTSAGLVTCSPLSIETPAPRKPSPVARWLSVRLPVSQLQAEYVWRRVGGDSVLARDVVRALRVLGVKDATGMSSSQFASYVDAVVGLHGAEDLVDQLLFERWGNAFASVVEQEFTRAEWSRILGLLGQRLDWLGPLHQALATNEQLDQVMRRLNIHRKWILYYAHREDPKHNIARRFDGKKVARCRRLLADFDTQLSRSKGVPSGFGESLVAGWLLGRS